MRCTHPRTVGFKTDGKTLSWSPKTNNKEYPTFLLPCGKCIECRLEYARQWAIRCVHEAQMYPQNCFITLTYSDKNLKSPKLIYSDFQKFMKRLRKSLVQPIGMFVTGEYGEHNKRPHWHAIIFNWTPSDCVYSYTNDNGDRVYNSKTLDSLWGHNDPDKAPSNIGDVTFKSAGYVARYAAKKLVHGHDDAHDFKPISKKSSKHAIGKKWLEQYWPDIFLNGKCILRDGTSTSIPRYYEKWLKTNHPGPWADYVTQTKQETINLAQAKAEIENSQWKEMVMARRGGSSKPFTPNQVRNIIIKTKLKLLHNHLKI